MHPSILAALSFAPGQSVLLSVPCVRFFFKTGKP